MARVFENVSPSFSIDPRALAQSFVHETLRQMSAGFEFELQPLMRTKDRSIYGHEYLYRGDRNISWERIDEAVLDYLCRGIAPVSEKAMFINLSHQSLIKIPDD